MQHLYFLPFSSAPFRARSIDVPILGKLAVVTAGLMASVPLHRTAQYRQQTDGLSRGWRDLLAVAGANNKGGWRTGLMRVRASVLPKSHVGTRVRLSRARSLVFAPHYLRRVDSSLTLACAYIQLSMGRRDRKCSINRVSCAHMLLLT